MVAKTIQAQIGGRCFVMIGAHNFIDHGDGLSFRFKGSRKANYMKVTLDAATDTYTVEFWKLGRAPKYNMTKVHETVGAYCDMLHGLIEDVTGLYTSLGTMGR